MRQCAIVGIQLAIDVYGPDERQSQAAITTDNTHTLDRTWTRFNPIENYIIGKCDYGQQMYFFFVNGKTIHFHVHFSLGLFVSPIANRKSFRHDDENRLSIFLVFVWNQAFRTEIALHFTNSTQLIQLSQSKRSTIKMKCRTLVTLLLRLIHSYDH